MISYEELSEVFDMDNPLTLEYFELCDKDTNEQVYFHKHHILPKSIYLDYAKSEWNIVRLCYKDHYRAHEILPLVCVQKKHKQQMACAWRRILHNKEGIEVCVDFYDKLCRLHRDAVATLQKGKVVSQETRDKQSLVRLGRTLTDEHKGKLAIALKGREFSEEHKAKLKESRKLRPYKPLSQSHKDSLSASTKGRKMSQEHKDKIAKALTGKPKSDEHKRKSRLSQIPPVEKLEEYLQGFRNFSLVDGYVSMNTEANFKCNCCGFRFTKTPSHAKKLNLCPQCKTKWKN